MPFCFRSDCRFVGPTRKTVGGSLGFLRATRKRTGIRRIKRFGLLAPPQPFASPSDLYRGRSARLQLRLKRKFGSAQEYYLSARTVHAERYTYDIRAHARVIIIIAAYPRGEFAKKFRRRRRRRRPRAQQCGPTGFFLFLFSFVIFPPPPVYRCRGGERRLFPPQGRHSRVHGNRAVPKPFSEHPWPTKHTAPETSAETGETRQGLSMDVLGPRSYRRFRWNPNSIP